MATNKRPRTESLEYKPVSESKSPLLVVEYSNRKVVIMRSTSYADTIVSIKKAFSQLRNVPDQQIQLFVEQFDDLAQVVEELWEELVSSLSLIKIVLTAPPIPATNAPPITALQFNIRTSKGLVETFSASPACPVIVIKSTISAARVLNIPSPAGFTLYYNGSVMGDHDTLAQHGVQDGDEIDIVPTGEVRKPGIYLFSPSPLTYIRVQLFVTKAWRLSGAYPPAPISTSFDDSLGRTISWTVDIRPNGLLLDQSTGQEVTNLIWEADANTTPLISPTTIPSMEMAAFNPARPTILPTNSVLLPSDKLKVYLDNALLAMELHAEARMSFITHTHIALRFLPQREYEASAPLSITPAPKITTRVFMLFKGVHESELGAWETAKIPAENWSDIVGVHKTKAGVTNLYRVLEWRGMEIQ